MEILLPPQCLTELSLIEVEEFLAHPASVIAASAVALARLTVGDDPYLVGALSV